MGKARGKLSGVSPGQRTAETTGGQGGSNSKEPPTKDKEGSEVIPRIGGLVQEICAKLRLHGGSSDQPAVQDGDKPYTLDWWLWDSF